MTTQNISPVVGILPTPVQPRAVHHANDDPSEATERTRAGGAGVAKSSDNATMTPGSLRSIQITGGFWAERQHLNHTRTLPHEIKWLKLRHAIANFDAVAAGTIADERVGREFADSDVYKVLEALAWESARTHSEPIEETIASITEHIAPAIDEDGYLNTQFGHAGQRPRYSDFEWGHELYCYGHLIQAGVARIRTGHGPEDALTKLALQVADHVCREFGDEGKQCIGGHPEIETALVELYRATENTEYLHQAQLFIERRGHGTLADIEFGRGYFQDDVPIREARVLHGHAVRALYLAAGAIDVAVETGDTQLFDAVRRQYEAALARRTYVTGGMGAHHQDEAFGDDYELPPDRAYCETCAGIGSIMVAWRLFLATKDVTWGDVIERVLYNIVATSLSESGEAFFYANTLHQRVPTHASEPDTLSLRAANAERSAWFEVSCCPPNISRTLAQLSSYVAAADENGIYLLQYVPASIVMTLGDNSRAAWGETDDVRVTECGAVQNGAKGERDTEDPRTVRLEVHTKYPWDPRIVITVLEAPQEDWELHLRIPTWAKGASVTHVRHVDRAHDLSDVDGIQGGADGTVRRASSRVEEATEMRTYDARPGVFDVHGAATGDTITLMLPLEPRFTFPDERIDAVRGCVAVERGPLVYCVESVRQTMLYRPHSEAEVSIDLESIAVDTDIPLVSDGHGIRAVGVVRALGDKVWPYSPVGNTEPVQKREAHYGDPRDRETEATEIRFTPYYQWGERGSTTMRIWVPVLVKKK